MISIKSEQDKLSKTNASEDDLYKKYVELESLKKEIAEQIKNIEETGDDDAKEKMAKIKLRYEENKDNFEVNPENIAENIDNLKKIQKRFDFYQKFINALKKNVDIDPGRLMGLTDGIFGMVMTLLIFSMALPEMQINNYSGFINFAYSMAQSIGITIVSFILIASFWIYHHEFIKPKKLNIPYLWINMLFLASISFIPFTTSIVGNYSHFFLANVIFGANIFLTITLFLVMFHYAHSRGFLEEKITKEEKKYIDHTLLIMMILTIVVNLLDFNVSNNCIYLFLLLPVISTFRDILFKIKKE